LGDTRLALGYFSDYPDLRAVTVCISPRHNDNLTEHTEEQSNEKEPTILQHSVSVRNSQEHEDQNHEADEAFKVFCGKAVMV
jgi:hypothetical protein